MGVGQVVSTERCLLLEEGETGVLLFDWVSIVRLLFRSRPFASWQPPMTICFVLAHKEGKTNRQG